MKQSIKAKLKDLNYRLDLMKKYLDMKRQEEDWHGVEDAASDIRDILSAITVLEELLEN